MEFKLIVTEPKEESNENINIIVHNKNSRSNKKKFDRHEYETKQLIWDLNKYLGNTKDNETSWQYNPSSEDLNEEMKAIDFVNILNSKNIFDFNYFPQNNDFLRVRLEYLNPRIKSKRRPYICTYISFLFKKDKWCINNGFDHIDIEYVEFKNGIIKY